MPSPAVAIALVALFVVLGGTAAAVQVARNSVGSGQLKNKAVTTKKIKNGAVTPPKTTMRWALVAADASIVKQSGGISAAINMTGDYYVNFGSSQTGRSVQVTPVYRDDDFSAVTTVAALCGGPPEGASCIVHNSPKFVFVGAATADTGLPDPQAFYITTF
ncbi:MAG: hypothetical protein EXQ70_06090 [Solirubrobacterales bacterium]|nr:hypothetical protein [Solirubrobacterales bacterium]